LAGAAVGAIKPMSERLAVFMTAALALPLLSLDAQADEPLLLSPEFGSSFSQYQESKGRMKADVYQVQAGLQVTDDLKLQFNGVRDVMAGASPRYNKLSHGAIVQTLSAATIWDRRDAMDFRADYAVNSDVKLGLNGGNSRENDYNSDYFNLDSSWELNQNMTTVHSGFGYSSDTVWAVTHKGGVQEIADPGRKGDKDVWKGVFGLTQILDKDSLVQANLTYTSSNGYLSDPYKVAWINSLNKTVDDRRPGYKQQTNLQFRYVRHFQELNSAALNCDYQFYADSWGVNGHTFEVSWQQPLPLGLMLSPRGRFYAQNAAYFYQPVFYATRSDANYSSDYRLASFGSLDGGVQLSREFFDRLKLTAAVDFYERKKGYAFGSGPGISQDDFTYSMYTVAMNLKF
jgi:hypothetical protein